MLHDGVIDVENGRFFKMEELIQKLGKISERFNSLSKIVDFIQEELTPRIFKENTFEIFEINKKMVDKILDLI